MTREGFAGDGSGAGETIPPLVDLAGFDLAELRSSTDPDVLGMVRFFVERCEQRAAYGGRKVERQD